MSVKEIISILALLLLCFLPLSVPFIIDYYFNRKARIIKKIKHLQFILKIINEKIEINSSNIPYLKALQIKQAKVLKKLNKAKIKQINYEI